MRLRGPGGGWASALAAFALLAPLFLVLTDILLVAVRTGKARPPGRTASGPRRLQFQPERRFRPNCLSASMMAASSCSASQAS